MTSTALGGTRMSRTKAGRPRRSPSTLRHTSPMHRDTRGASMGLPLTKRNWRSPPPPLGPGASKPPARDMRPMTAKEQSSPPLRSKLTSSSDRANACPKSAEALSRSDLGACTAIAVRRVAPPPLTRVSRRRQPKRGQSLRSPVHEPSGECRTCVDGAGPSLAGKTISPLSSPSDAK